MFCNPVGVRHILVKLENKQEYKAFWHLQTSKILGYETFPGYEAFMDFSNGGLKPFDSEKWIHPTGYTAQNMNTSFHHRWKHTPPFCCEFPRVYSPPERKKVKLNFLIFYSYPSLNFALHKFKIQINFLFVVLTYEVKHILLVIDVF